MRVGQVAAAVYNVNRGKKTDKVWSPVDFILRFDRDSKQEASRALTGVDRWHEDKQQIKAYAKAMKAKRDAK